MMSENKGTLYLIPTVIADDTEQKVLPPHVMITLPRLRYFLAENPRTTRRFLSKLKIFESIESLSVEQLDKDTTASDVARLMKPVEDGHDIGILSESGCPGIADPGSLAVEHAHRHGVKVIPLVGPSSILLALMASGLNGQSFCFHGYLPVNGKELTQMLKTLEKESKMQNRTQVFIETPYRNGAIFKQLVNTLQPLTRLCIAVDVTGNHEFIRMHPVREWREQSLTPPKSPCVFLFQA